MKINTKDMSVEEWRQLRKKSIGGSDAATILGLNKWKSPYELVLEKRGVIADIPDNDAMRTGRDLEDYVAKRFEEATGKKVRKSNFMHYKEEAPYLSANVDREIVGENAALECKTTSAFNKNDFENGEIPLYYYCQCVHYMNVLGYAKMYLAVLVGGQKFYHFEIPRQESEIEALQRAEEEFYKKYMEGDEDPSELVTGSDSDGDILQKMYPKETETETLLLFDLEEQIEEMERLKEEQKEMERKIKEIENRVKAEMGEFEKGIMNRYTVTWKSQNRTSIDTKKLKAEEPEVAKRYMTTSTSRVFRVKKNKEDK